MYTRILIPSAQQYFKNSIYWWVVLDVWENLFVFVHRSEAETQPYEERQSSYVLDSKNVILTVLCMTSLQLQLFQRTVDNQNILFPIKKPANKTNLMK